MSYTVRVGGEWAHQLSPVGDITFSWGVNGPLAASWNMALPDGFLHPALVQGQTVEIFYCGASRVWRGVLEEPNRDEWTCKAVGFSEHFRHVMNLTYHPDGTPELDAISITDAIMNAIGRGFDFKFDDVVPEWPDGFNPSFLKISPSDDSVLSLRGLLDALAKTAGLRWMVDENGWLRFLEEPDGPEMVLTPDVPGVGLTVDNYYSATYVRYRAGTDGTGEPILATAVAYSEDAWRWGPRERAFITDLERVVGGAGVVAQVMQDEAVASPMYGVEIQHGQLQNLGGTPIAPPLLRTALKVRHYGVLEVPGARDVNEWYVGHFEVDTEAGTVTVTPQHVAPRTMAQALQDINKRDGERRLPSFYDPGAGDGGGEDL